MPKYVISFFPLVMNFASAKINEDMKETEQEKERDKEKNMIKKIQPEQSTITSVFKQVKKKNVTGTCKSRSCW